MITEKQTGAIVEPELWQILEDIDKSDKKADKIEKIKSYSRYVYFTDWLRAVFDDRIQFALPEGRPPFTIAGEGAQPSSYRRRYKEYGKFVKGREMNQIKREMAFIGLLESIHPKDALHVADSTDKRHSTSLTKELIEEVLPGLVSPAK